MEYTLQTMAVEHLDRVLAIERTFAAPWTREMFLQELRLQSDISDARVALRQDEVVGYVLCWYVADEVHIVNLAVHTAWRRQGLARGLMADALARARAHGARMATLEVRVHNDAAIRLYDSLGFRQVAIRKGYYADNGEDALVMLKDLEPGGGA